MGPFNFQKAKRIGRKLLGMTAVKEPALVFEHARVETPGNPPLNVFPHEEYRIHYLTEEGAVNRALEGILDGVVGFDTEYGKRIPTDEEAFITQALNDVGGQKKWGVLAWQIMEQRAPKRFAIPWDNIALCLVQIARDSDVWVVDLRKMRAYPKELKRILDSPDIVKAGVGVTADIAHVWADLRTNIHNVVDAGCMARLLLAHKYSDNQFGNLSLQVSAAEILGYDIDKEERESDWTGDITKAQKLYAATDAAVSLRLYERLVPALEQHRRSLGVSILENWYTMNGKYGEPMRKNLTIRGEEATWSVKDCYWFTGNEQRTAKKKPVGTRYLRVNGKRKMLMMRNQRSQMRSRLDHPTFTCDSTTSTMDVPTDDISLQRCSHLWLEDGNIVFQAQNRLFRVHMSILERKSNVFAALPQPIEPTETVDGFPIARVPDNADDFESFLMAVVDTESVPARGHRTEMQKVAGILRIASKYCASTIQARCVDYLEGLFPTYLYQRDNKPAAQSISSLSHAFPIVQDLGLLWMIPSICCQILSHSGHIADPLRSIDIKLLDGFRLEDRLIILQGAATYLNGHRFILDEMNSIDTACSVEGCHERREDLLNEGVNIPPADPFAMGSLDDMWPTIRHALCSDCTQECQNRWEGARHSLWDALPLAFGLQAWDHLRMLRLRWRSSEGLPEEDEDE
ncbi:hypothetical protein DFH06DRAFT_1132605 [Mycena polygramma]|nr:hypothetical protein DFH06DRAFT_1132605 [Mycena polygramma]